MSLADLKLTTLPESLGQLTALRSLDLSGNHLTILPESLGQLTALKELYLGSNELTVLPEWLGRLTALETLYLSRNRLTVLPEWLGRLTALKNLFLNRNQVTALPESLGQLTALKGLYLERNRLTALPESLRQLTALEGLGLSGNRLTVVPEWFGRLTALDRLYLDHNQLIALPEWLGQLTALRRLYLNNNQLTALPEWLGQLTALEDLQVGGNDLQFPPASVVAGGMTAIQEFLRASTRETDRQWRSKLLIVGEGQAGKTTLLKALATQTPDPKEPTTHGLNIENLSLAHPKIPNIHMQLSVWDFGGQHVYHATHQFFLTDQSLFLLVWNARLGWAKAEGRYWLDVIAARTRTDPGRNAAPVILVATHSEDRAPDLPLAELERDYPNIIGHIETDAFAPDEIGMDQLRTLIAAAAADLPLMGSRWPASWLAAQQACRDSPHSHLGIDRFDDLLARAGLAEPAARQSVTGVLHQLGEILHYPGDRDLAGTVVLKPQWLSERIAAILDSPRVAAAHGLLTTRDIDEQWSDLDKDLQAQLLSMMDRYDVSYRITDHDDARAIVVDRLPWEPPPYQRDWESLAPPRSRRLRLDYQLGATVPPGIPGWFIARAHQFATTGHRPWREGVLLAHPDRAHLGLLRLDRTTNTVRLEVRGPRPAGFLNMLDLYFNHATLRRYPGLTVTRTVPCPCRPGCPSSFKYDNLTNLYDTLEVPEIRCLESGALLQIAELIDGIAPTTLSPTTSLLIGGDQHGIARRLEELTAAVQRSDARQGEYAEQLQLHFAQIMGWLQVSTPTVFTVTEKPRHVPGAHRYILRLYCAEPTAAHPLPGDQGCYQFAALDPWAGALLRHLATVASLLSHAAGLTGEILGVSARTLLGRTSEDLKNMGELLESLGSGGENLLGSFGDPYQLHSRATNEADARSIEQLLHKLDPQQRWGGLAKTTTPSGLTLYLCAAHEAAYRAASARPRGI